LQGAQSGDGYVTIIPVLLPSSQPSSQPSSSPSLQPTSRPPGTIFHYTGNIQKYLVPSAPGTVFVQLWGGGGAGSTYQNTGNSSTKFTSLTS